MASKKLKKAKSKSKKIVAKAKTKKTVKAKSPKIAKKKNVVAKSLSAKSSASLFKFHPLDDRVLVEREEASQKTSGGIFIPGTASETPTRGTVVSVGPGHKGKKGLLRPTDVKPGQRVIFSKYSGNEIHLGDKDYIIMRETDIIGIVEE